MPKAKLKYLEEIFRSGVFTMLKEEGKITDEIITKLIKLRHSGFSLCNGIRIARDDEKRQGVSRTVILRNPISLEKVNYNDKSRTSIYCSKITHGKNKKSLCIYPALYFYNKDNKINT
jgi:hypothetical protein